MFIKLPPVPRPLQPYIASIRIIEQQSTHESEIDVYLNGLPGIVFQHQDGYPPLKHVTTRIGQASNTSTLYVYGQTKNPGKMTYNAGRFTTIQFVMKPDALQGLMGINASVITNQIVDLGAFSADDLNRQLLDAQSPEVAVHMISRFLMSQLDVHNSSDDLVKQSLYLIGQNQLRVSDLIQELNVSERQFERRFKQAVGVTPKFYIRIKRFNSALRLMNTGKFTSLTQLAHHLNYHDQSHFIRDVKAFTNVSPKMLTQRLDNPHPQQTVFSYRTT